MATAKPASPGQWRSHSAAAASLDGNLFAQLDQVARRLHDLGLDDLEDRLRKAAALARTRPEQAAAALRELVPELLARAPAYGHGVREIVSGMPDLAEKPDAKISDDDGIPGLHPY